MMEASETTTIVRGADPQEFSMRLVTGFWLSRAVWLAARLRLADAVGAGPATPDEVAEATGASPDATERLLRALASAELFELDDDGRYRPTPAGELLRSDHPSSQRALIDVVIGGDHYEAWGSLEEAVRSGRTAFEVRHGASWIEYYSANPDAGRAFAEAMSGTTRAFEDAIVAADPFPAFRFAVDVGGSHGSLLRRLLERNPDARGVVLDLPEVIAGWPPGAAGELDGRFTGIGGDFFESVPEGGDLYLLKLILHDWDDERAETILRRVHEAVASDGRLAIVDTVLPESPIPEHPGWLADLNMLAMTGGRERTAAEFATLLERTGWRLERVVPTRSLLSVVLASAVTAK
jgi:hypothetical protein